MKKSIIAENLKRIIKEKGYKQSAIADRAGIPRQTFSNMMNHRKIIADYDIEILVDVLGISPNELFSRPA